MPNNTISQVEVNGTTYDLLDANTLSAVSAIESRVTALEDSVDAVKTSLTNINLEGGWYLGFYINGWGFIVPVPTFKNGPVSVTFYNSYASAFTGNGGTDGWHRLKLTTSSNPGNGMTLLNFNTLDNPISNIFSVGCSYLVRNILKIIVS